MDRSLDEVVRERENNRNRRQRRNTPRGGGVRKPTSGSSRNGGYDESRLWVHDKFDDIPSPGSRRPPRSSPGGRRLDAPPAAGAKVKVTNLHYELTEEELMDLFRRKGDVLKLEIMYDRAGRSEGTCFVTFARESDAVAAIRDYDGATAKGQLITVSLVGPPPTRSLFERIASPAAADDAPIARDSRRDPTRKPTPPGIDRYVPPERRRERERGGGGGGERTQSGPRSAVPRDRERPRGGRGRAEKGGRGEKSSGSNIRPKKTVEELDAEMNDYFGGANQEEGAAPAAAAVEEKAAVDDDGDLIL